MDEEQIEEEYLSDQIFLWEQQYAEEDKIRMELSAEEPRKPAIIITIKPEEHVFANPDNAGTNNPAKRKFHARKSGKKH